MPNPTEALIRVFIVNKQWLPDIDTVEFLAAGEYNENYLLRAGSDTYVFRINRGSQLGLEDQISYEYSVLKCVEPSRRTPVPIRCHSADDDFPGAMLMSFIPGRPFAYLTDDKRAANTLAIIHALPVEDAQQLLIRQEDAVASIVSESLGLLNRQDEHPLRDVKSRLLRYVDALQRDIVALPKGRGDSIACITNTELNSGNFICRDGIAYLVDWEKAVISARYQDLAHFLVPTTTLWKSEFRYDEQNRMDFLEVYAESYKRQTGIALSVDEVSERTATLERVILLRALSWCYMAYFEYLGGQRALTNEATFARIRWYMDEVEWFLK